MPSYYLTVGVKYADEEHPQELHPEGWVRIVADNYQQAREAAFDRYGDRWAFLYTHKEWVSKERPSYVRGELALVFATRTQEALYHLAMAARIEWEAAGGAEEVPEDDPVHQHVQMFINAVLQD